MNNTFGDNLLVLKRVDNKVTIKQTFTKDFDRFPLGSQIITINGLPTEQYIRASVALYISASTKYVRANIASSMLLSGFPGSTFSVKIRKPDGQEAAYVLIKSVSCHKGIHTRSCCLRNERKPCNQCKR